MVDPSGLTGALFMAACLVVAGIIAVIGGLGWLIWYLFLHVSVTWIP